MRDPKAIINHMLNLVRRVNNPHLLHSNCSGFEFPVGYLGDGANIKAIKRYRLDIGKALLEGRPSLLIIDDADRYRTKNIICLSNILMLLPSPCNPKPIPTERVLRFLKDTCFANTLEWITSIWSHTTENRVDEENLQYLLHKRNNLIYD